MSEKKTWVGDHSGFFMCVTIRGNVRSIHVTLHLYVVLVTSNLQVLKELDLYYTWFCIAAVITL
jgi:hypothetical protein